MVRNWFNNLKGQKARKASASRLKLDILKPRGRRALQATEIYSRKHYAERIRPLVEAAKATLGRKPTRAERLKIIKDSTAAAYKNESREVKEETEAERLAQHEDNSSSDSDSKTSDDGDETHRVMANAVKRQAYVACACYDVEYYADCGSLSALDDLPTMLQQVSAEIHRLTGWHFMVLGAGTLPDEEDRFESIV